MLKGTIDNGLRIAINGELRVAIIGGFKYHLECAGFICELFPHNVEINLYYKEEYFGYIPYYQKIYKNLRVFTTFTEKDILENNIIIKLTSNDPILEDERIISILHVHNMQGKSAKYIALSPFVSQTSDKLIKYIFPLYNGIKTVSNNKIITYIGQFQPEYFDEDLKQMISSLPDYQFYFVSHKIDPMLFNAHRNVLCFPECAASEMIELVTQSKYILHRHIQFSNFDRFSGALSIAVSHRKPLILSTYFAETYNIPAITYDYLFCETIDKINAMTDNEYDLELNKIEAFVNKQKDANKNAFQELIKYNHI